MTDTETALRAWANGIYATEAGVELLINTGFAVSENSPWITWSGQYAAIDVEALLDHSGVWSGGEKRVVRIAASLLGGPPVDLSEALPGLDRRMMSEVLAALAHANGSHEHSEMTFDADGVPKGFQRLPSLHPWLVRSSL